MTLLRIKIIPITLAFAFIIGILPLEAKIRFKPSYESFSMYMDTGKNTYNNWLKESYGLKSFKMNGFSLYGYFEDIQVDFVPPDLNTSLGVFFRSMDGEFSYVDLNGEKVPSNKIEVFIFGGSVALSKIYEKNRFTLGGDFGLATASVKIKTYYDENITTGNVEDNSKYQSDSSSGFGFSLFGEYSYELLSQIQAGLTLGYHRYAIQIYKTSKAASKDDSNKSIDSNLYIQGSYLGIHANIYF